MKQQKEMPSLKSSKIIHITSLAKKTRVTIQNGKRSLQKQYFNSIPEAIDFILPVGDRQTKCLLNGYLMTLQGWWE